MERTHPNRFALLIVVLVAALVLRCAVVLAPAFWEGEVVVIARAAMPTAEIVQMALTGKASPVFPAAVHQAMRFSAAMGHPLGTGVHELRLLSLFAGMATVLLAVAAARRWWGGPAAIWTAVFVGLMPAMVLASGMLLPAACVQLIALAATLMWIRLGGPGPSAAGRWVLAVVYAGLMLIGFALDRWMPALWFAHLLAFAGTAWPGRRAGAPGAATVPAVPRVAALLAAGGGILAWPHVLRSLAGVWVAGGALPSSASSTPGILAFLIGGFGAAVPEGSGLTLLLGALVIVLAVWCFARIVRGEVEGERGRCDDPAVGVLAAIAGLSLVLWVLPGTRGATEAEFLPLAGPMLTLALGWWVSRISQVRARGAGWVLIAGLALGICSGFLVVDWSGSRQEGEVFRRLRLITAPLPGDRIAWTQPLVAPWLRRAGEFRLLDPASALATTDRPPDDRPTWFVSHKGTLSPLGSPLTNEQALLEHLLATTPGVVRVVVPPEWERWRAIWLVPPGILADLVRRWEQGRLQMARAIAPPPGGQVLTPLDSAFRHGMGWSAVEFDPELRPWCWSIGGEQRLIWPGPAQPGEYEVTIHGRRPSPWPTLAYEIACRLPGDSAWRTLAVEPGPVVLAARTRINRPRQLLEARFRIPCWLPWRYQDGNPDARCLGIQFARVEVSPVENTGVASTEMLDSTGISPVR